MLYYQVLIPLLGLILSREVFTEVIPLTIPVQVLEVMDGDTLVVSGGGGQWTVRLAGVDAPEKGQSTRLAGMDAGKVASSCLSREVRERSWLLVWRGRDIYHRVLGDLTSKGQSLSLRLVEKGCVSVYPFLNDFTRPKRQEFKQKLNRAQRARLGLWKYGGFMRPYAWRKLQKTRRKPVEAE